MIYVLLADGFEEIEAIAPIDVMRRGGLNVATAGVGKKDITGSHSITITADMSVDEINTEDVEGIILPGGMPGTLNLQKNEKVIELVRYCYENEILLAAICAAPKVFGVLGLLSGVKATCYPGFEAKLVGAVCKRKDVVSDKNFITAKGAGVTQNFAEAIADKLGKGAVCRRVIKGMYY